MPRAVLSLMVVTCLCAHVAAQRPPVPVPPEPKTPPATAQIRDLEYPVTLEGCVRGRRFVPSGDSLPTRETMRLLEASEFVLEGPKELLDLLKQGHENHQDEITGVALVPARERNGDVKTWDVDDKTRIVVGHDASTRIDGSLPDVRKPRILRLRVEALTHLDDKCWAPR